MKKKLLELPNIKKDVRRVKGNSEVIISFNTVFMSNILLLKVYINKIFIMFIYMKNTKREKCSSPAHMYLKPMDPKCFMSVALKHIGSFSAFQI